MLHQIKLNPNFPRFERDGDLMKVIEIGSAKSAPEKLIYGFIDSLDLPTGTTEKIPVMIAQGAEDGPTFF